MSRIILIEFQPHDEATAPEASQPLLARSKKACGMIPGLHAVMAEAPGLLEAYYQRTHELFASSSFDKDELTVVWQTVNVGHACHHCVPAHTGIAKNMRVDDAITRNRGNVDEPALQACLDAGFNKRHILEVILGVSQKVMSNYTNHLAQTPVDAPFRPLERRKAA